MAHGAPDHVRMGDVNLTDYPVHLYDENVQLIDPGEHWTPVDLLGVGCMGLTFFSTNYREMLLRITIDGVRVFYESPETLHLFHVSLGACVSNHAGIGHYDDVNHKYSMWVDFHYLLPFVRTLEIDFYNNDPLVKTLWYLRCYYKLKG